MAAAATANDAIEIATRGRTGSIKQVHLHGNRVQEVRQRQPHRANLLPSGCDAVEDAPRDDQMSARVVVAECETEAMIMERRDGSADRR